MADGWEAGLRYGWVELGANGDGFARLQYNHEDHDDFGGEDSVWLQFGLNWGSEEVR